MRGVHHFTIQAALGWSGVPEDAEAQKEKSSGLAKLVLAGDPRLEHHRAGARAIGELDPPT